MMSPERWKQIEDVFQQAADLSDAERYAYIEEACQGDAELRAEVVSLLESEGISHVAPSLEEVAKSVSGIGSLEGARLGVYQIEGPIGEGGMGTVYKANRVDGQFDQQVAIKIIRPGAATSLHSQRFIEERSMLAQLQHPFIARLIDGGDHSGIPYLVMELIDGQRIDDYCRQWNLNVNERLELFLKVCDAVQHAHSALIVHRDIKPSNIFVTNDGVPKLLDFGIASLVAEEGEANPETWMMMTPDYASPEQVMGQTVGVTSDVYSLGIVLYELLTGDRPYKINDYTPSNIRHAVCTTEIRPPSTFVLAETKLRRQLEGDLDNILLMALRKEPERRYGSVAQLAEDIRRHMAGETVIARPDTFHYRWSKYIRRHRVSITLAAALILAMLAGVGLMVRESIRSQRRFEEVRGLANSLLNDIDPEAARLLGAAKLRRLMVEKSLDYLDKLARESGGDFELQKEVARAYHRVGDIQGHSRGDNLGMFNESLESHLKAITIEEPLLARKPNDNQLRQSLAMGYAHIGDLHARRMKRKLAAEFVGKAYSLVDTSSPNTYIDVRISMARAYMIDGRFDDSARVGAEAIALAQKLGLTTRIITVAIILGDTAKFKGDLQTQRKWVDLGIQLSGEPSTAVEMRTDEELRLATLYFDRGEIYGSADQPNQLRPCEAISDLAHASEMHERFLRTGGNTANLLVNAASSLHALATAQALCGDPRAIATAQHAVEVFNRGSQRKNPHNELALGIANLHAGHLDAARRYFEQIAGEDPLATEYIAKIALRRNDNAEAIRLLTDARNRRATELIRRSYMSGWEAYRQAENLSLAIGAGDKTPGLKQAALSLLDQFPAKDAAASIEALRNRLRSQ